MIKSKEYKDSLVEYTRRWRKTSVGLLSTIYSSQLVTSKKRGFPLPTYSAEDLREKFLTNEKYKRLHEQWVKSKFNKSLTPSIDRINNKYPYKLDNIQILTWAENRFKQIMERRNRGGAIFQTMGDSIVKKYLSQRDAAIKTGISQSNIGSVINGKRKTAGGYGWKRIKH